METKRQPRSHKRKILGSTLALLAALFVFSLLIDFTRAETTMTTDHFNGKKFFNPEIDDALHGFTDMVKWQFTREPGVWREYIDLSPGPPPPARVATGELRVTFVNHSTVLLQIDGLNFLTDPIWSDRAGPVSWAGVKRVHSPGIRFDDLPPIDAILLSHNHYDHLDLPTLRRLRDKWNPPIYTGLGNDRYLAKKGFTKVTALDWWQATTGPGGMKITFLPAQHFSGRSLTDHFKTLWGGFYLDSSSGGVYFAGDTGYASHFRQIRERLGAPRLALLPIGAYEPRWFMAKMHTNPEDAVKAHLELGAAASMGIHFGTFRLADDGQDQPVADLQKARERSFIAPEQFFTLSPGEGKNLPSVQRQGN